MSEKQLKIFGIAFLSLLILYLITKPGNQSVDIDKLVQSIVIGVEPEDIGSIEIYKETGENKNAKLIFNKKDNQWRITNHFNCKAENSKMERLINDVLEMTGKVRSSDPDKLDLYKITDSQGLHMILKDEGGNTLANLIIGKKTKDPGSGFVRISGHNKVYFTDKDLLASIGFFGEIDTMTTFNVERFVDLDAVVINRDNLEMIGLVKNGRELVVKQIEKKQDKADKKDSTSVPVSTKEWVLVKGKKELSLNKDEVKRFLDDVTKIFAHEVIDRVGGTFADYNKSVKYGFQNSRTYLVFQTPDQHRKAVIFGKKYEKDKGYYMLVKYDDGLVYKVTKSTFDKIYKWIDDLPKRVK